MSDFNDNDLDVTALSSTEMAARVELLKVEAKMTLQMKKNGATADNQDVDIAQVCFKNMSEGTKPIVIDYKIESGTAVFLENKQKTLRKHTNRSLSSTVQLINGTPGKGMLKATPYLNPKMAPPPVEYEFVGPARKLKLVLDVTTDNQLADGTGIDIVTATLIDETTNKPISNEKLDFELSTSDAQFEGGGTKIQATTDADGKVIVRITSNAKANISVTLTATVVAEPSVSQKAVVNFKAKLWKLALTANPNGQYSDGVAADVVIATLTDENNKPLSNVRISFVLSDSIAQFTSGGTSVTVTTDTNGKAIVRITSKANSDIYLTVTATVVDDPKITQSIVINFKAKVIPRVLKLVLTVERDCAHSDGINTNIVTATLTDQMTYRPVSNERLSFFLANQTSRFTNQSTSIILTTDINGKATVHITNNANADVLERVLCGMYENISVDDMVYIRFVEPPQRASRPQPQPQPPTTRNWPITVRVSNAENIYGPTYPISANHHRCELVIFPNSVPDRTFEISIISNSPQFALGDAGGGFGRSIRAYGIQTFFLGILRNMTSDLGATIEIRAAQGVVWRGIVYPRSSRLTIIN